MRTTATEKMKAQTEPTAAEIALEKATKRSQIVLGFSSEECALDWLMPDATPARLAALVETPTAYASNAVTALAGTTPVSRCSRPWNLYESFAWSMPMQCRMVALRSRRWTGFSTTL